ncbi:MAG: hypothetical protein CL827_00685 [Crocinitomicaceae bacterium]|nr:hypothetical protein [Crocinitomicaceae bacterium]
MMKNNQIPRSIKLLNSFSKVSFWFTVGVSIIILFVIIYLLLGGSLEGDIKFGDNNYQNFNEVSLLSKLWLLIITVLAMIPIILITHFFSKFMNLVYNGKYFEIETIKFLKWISYLLLSIYLVGIFSEFLISIDSNFNDSLSSNLNFQADNISLSLPIFALILWVLSHIFSQGVKMKKLNDLTI